jgi:hypothetical protein
MKKIYIMKEKKRLFFVQTTGEINNSIVEGSEALILLILTRAPQNLRRKINAKIMLRTLESTGSYYVTNPRSFLRVKIITCNDSKLVRESRTHKYFTCSLDNGNPRLHAQSQRKIAELLGTMMRVKTYVRRGERAHTTIHTDDFYDDIGVQSKNYKII